MKQINVVDEKFKLPGNVDYPVTIRFPFMTERLSKPNEIGYQDVRRWYKKKRQLPDNQMMINKELYEVIEDGQRKLSVS